MKRILILTIVSLILLSCGAPTSSSTEISETNFPFTETKSPTKTPIPPTSTFPFETQIPTSTTTPAPVIDAQGNITWRPQQVLVLSEGGGGDGVSYDYPPEFLLLWDGTLFQPDNGKLYVSNLDNQEVCKILNTTNFSGFFEEDRFYNFPFDGLGSHYISVNAWKTNSSGAQILSYAISGAVYYHGLFCRDCPIPSPDTIIKPGLANVYFLLKNYYSPNRQEVQFDKVKVYMYYTDEPATHSWPYKSISIDEFVQQCEEAYCSDVGQIFDGDIAKEIFEKGDSSQIFGTTFSGRTITFRLRFRPVWPYETSIMYAGSEDSAWKEMPSNYTLTCNAVMGTYPILPLNPQNQFWYYSPDGKWGAEIVSNPSQYEQVRVVSTFGYEKYYEYNPELFGQTEIKVYPRYWTKDEKYFLVNVLPNGYDIQKTPFVNSLGLQRISIDDGKLDYVFIGVDGQSFAYNVSEEYEQIAYIRQGGIPLKIVLKNIHTLKEKSAALILPDEDNIQYSDAGTIFWSIDGKFLVVAANYAIDEQLNTVVIKIDTSNPAVQSVLYRDNKALKLVSDYDPYHASLCPLTANIETRCSKVLNLETGTVE